MQLANPIWNVQKTANVHLVILDCVVPFYKRGGGWAPRVGFHINAAGSGVRWPVWAGSDDEYTYRYYGALLLRLRTDLEFNGTWRDGLTTGGFRETAKCMCETRLFNV